MTPELPIDRMSPMADATVLGLLAALAEPALWMQVAVVLVALARLVELFRGIWLSRKQATETAGGE